eukprot:scaffold17701_cov38-Cyclotella_meneghiniana.AAC.3
MSQTEKMSSHTPPSYTYPCMPKLARKEEIVKERPSFTQTQHRTVIIRARTRGERISHFTQ